MTRQGEQGNHSGECRRFLVLGCSYVDVVIAQITVSQRAQDRVRQTRLNVEGDYDVRT